MERRSCFRRGASRSASRQAWGDGSERRSRSGQRDRAHVAGRQRSGCRRSLKARINDIHEKNLLPRNADRAFYDRIELITEALNTVYKSLGKASCS